MAVDFLSAGLYKSCFYAVGSFENPFLKFIPYPLNFAGKILNLKFLHVAR